MKNNTVLYLQCTHKTQIKERGDDVQFSLLRHSTLIAIPSLAFQTTDSPSNHNSSLYSSYWYILVLTILLLLAFYQAMLVATDVFSSYVGSYSSKPALHCVVLSRFWVQRYPDKWTPGWHPPSTIPYWHPQSTIHNPSPRRRREREMSEDLEQTQSIFIELPHSSFVFVVLPQYNSGWVARQEIPTTQTQTQHPFFSPPAASSSVASNSKWELFLCSAFFKDFNFIFQSTLASMMHRKFYWNGIYWATVFHALTRKKILPQ